MPINPNAPKTTPVAAPQAKKPAAPVHEKDAVKKEITQQQQHDTFLAQSAQNPLASFAPGARPSVQVTIAASNMGTAALKEEDRKKDLKTTDARAKAPAPKQQSFLDVIQTRFEVTKRAFQGAAEMLVGDSLHKGFETLRKANLTPQQQQTFAMATSSSKQAYRAGILAQAGSQVSRKIYEKN